MILEHMYLLTLSDQINVIMGGLRMIFLAYFCLLVMRDVTPVRARCIDKALILVPLIAWL